VMLSLYTITYSHLARKGTWHAQDDFEFKGWGPERVTGIWKVVAPHESLARAQCAGGEVAASDFRIDNVERTSIDAIVTVTQ
jgi:hypothetical protein